MAKTNELHGTVIEHMREISDLNEALFSYMRRNKLWLAIAEHIISKNCVLINHPKNHFIPCHRGTGPSICFHHASLYAKNYDDPRNPREADVFRIEFRVGYVHNDDEDTYSYSLHERSVRYEIQV